MNKVRNLPSSLGATFTADSRPASAELMLKWSILSLTLIWIIFLVYLGLQDWTAFWVSLLLTPPFGALLYFAIKSQNTILAIFTGLAFVGHAIGSPFFFLARERYSYSGWGAVKDFNFELSGFFLIYLLVLLAMVSIVGFTIALDRLRLHPARSMHIRKRRGGLAEAFSSREGLQVVRPRGFGAKKCTALLIAVIVVIGIPINIFMYMNRIGIVGVMSPLQSFRLVGILYYFRMFALPVGMFYLYDKSTRSPAAVTAVLAYALFAGLSSASRGIMAIALFPIIAFSVTDRRYGRLFLSIMAVVFGFVLVSGARDAIYQELGHGYLELIQDSASVLFDPSFSLLDQIGGIANRLYGPQDMVLSYQYYHPDPWSAIPHYFLSGGRADSVVNDLMYEFYGLVFPDSSGFGVGIGLLAYILILGHDNFLHLVISSFLAACLLSASNRMLIGASRTVFGPRRSPLADLIAYFGAFSLYSSTIKFLYWQDVILIGVIVLYPILIRRAHSAGNPQQVGQT